MSQKYNKQKQAQALYSELQLIEEKTRFETRSAYAHPDDEDFQEQLDAGREEFPRSSRSLVDGQ
ncbi:MAG: hypothetical protein IPK17_38395 [Chloroflexi bacterium]|uniref:hypothetical protein n=1 Tax=Candidatus Flexifilum breve TaxID=3140694 RepID=UPI0031375ACB|nr:hypothetical protein [Chloroflexota bacterium]